MKLKDSRLSLLFLLTSEMEKCPRARRLYLNLQLQHNVKYIPRAGYNDCNDENRLRYLNKRITSPFFRWFTKQLIKFGWFNLAVKNETYKYDFGKIDDGDFDYIFVFDLFVLPIVAHFTKTKVIFDARECYPLQFADKNTWKKTRGRLAEYVCQQFIHKTYKTMTVSPSLVDYYQQLTNREILLFPSFPRSSLLVDKQKESLVRPIRLIHHGLALEKRGLEKMIDLMSILGDEYQLDMMLVHNPGNKYYQTLVDKASLCANVNIIPPVKPDDIIPFCSQYDLGLFLMADNGSQNKYCLPNKYFEFLYAGLPVITNCSLDMQLYTEKYAVGLAFTDEPLEEIAKKILALSEDDISGYRANIENNTQYWSLEFNLTKQFPELSVGRNSGVK